MSLLRSLVQPICRVKCLSILQTHTAPQTRSIKRWVAPTLRELRKRARKAGPHQEIPVRSQFAEWNYRSELFAFSQRLHEDFQLPLLQTAFTTRSYVLQEEQRQRDLGVETANVHLADNRELVSAGTELTRDCVTAFLLANLPQVPAEGQLAIAEYLLSQEYLAHVAKHLGVTDLIFSADYPPTEADMAHVLLAVIAALEKSSGKARCELFIQDFICTGLNQRDLTELWQIENPEELLRKVCKERQLAEPEPRIIGESAKNTVLAAYQVGIYSNKRLIGKGFGENLPTAVQTASLDALRAFFGIKDNMRPFKFNALQTQ